MNEKSLVDFTKFKIVEIEQLVGADWNYKEENDALSAKLIANIKRNGQVENLLVRMLPTGFYEVVNGNHRLTALKALGATKAVVYDLGSISANEAHRIAIETNETKFNVDQVKLAQLMNEMSVDFTVEELLETMPYTQQDIDNFINMHNFDMDNFDKSTAPTDDVGSSQKAENLISFKLNDDALILWKKWKDMVAVESGEMQSDYTCLMRSLECAVRWLEESDNFFKSPPRK